MEAERWRLVEEIFQGALERTPLERSEYVREASGGAADLQAEVLSLLDFDPDAEGVLRDLIAENASGWVDEQESQETGTHVGSFLLVRELDRGGMGTVHLAVRSDDQYFQIVAIKMIRKGYATAELIQRFRAERQILATLTHPNVGAILDGGVTQDGRPFMVMEYVEGLSITQASKARGLSVRDRIDLFRAVCSAVHHAHQKLIIHRDIKPDNVLVTPEGTVKLIDFGIAKPVHSGLFLSNDLPNETTSCPMTPDYASPEQLTNQELTVSTDIYSLGVLLYELLTGAPPYSLRGLSPTAMERLVLAKPRTRPSAAPNLDARTRRELSGDLDYIVLKSLETSPKRRYASALQLEEDLVRYLENRPVLAKQASPLYTLRKFVKRHRSATITVCVSAAVLACALTGYTVRSRRVDRKVEDIRSLADFTISQMTSDLQQAPASTEAQAAVFHRALDFLNALDAHMGDDPRLDLELSNAYLRVGDLEGSPAVPNLGNSGTAILSYQLALQHAMRAHDRLPSENSTVTIIKSHQHLAAMYTFLGEVRKADEQFQEALGWALPFWKKESGDFTRKSLLAMIYLDMGDNVLSKLRPDDALKQDAAALGVFGTEPSGNEDHDALLIDMYLHQSAAFNEIGNQPEALAGVQRAMQLAEELVRQHPASAKAQRKIVAVYSRQVLLLTGRDLLNVSDSARSIQYAQKMLSLAEALAANDTRNAQAAFDRSNALTKMGDAYRQASPETAALWYEKAIDAARTLQPRYGSEARHRLAVQYEALAEVLTEPRQAQQQLQLLRSANLIRRELADSSPHARLHLMRSYCRLSDAQLGRRDIAGALEDARGALPMLAEFDLASPSLLVLRDVGFCLESLGNLQSEIAADAKRPAGERRAAKDSAHSLYQRSAEVWNDWSHRGAATPESEQERRRVTRLLSAERIAH